MDAIRPAELDQRLEDGDDVFVLDIRRETDFDAGHIEGSYNAPVYDHLDGSGDALDPYLDQVPKDVLVVTVCPVGVNAKTAAAALRDRDYESVPLKGGIRMWRKYESGSFEYRLRSRLRSLFS